MNCLVKKLSLKVSLKCPNLLDFNTNWKDEYLQ